MREPQAQVQQILDDLVERDVERGLQVAAYFDGELVVDAWSGAADPTTGRKVDGNTLFTVWSCTKGVAATVIHLGPSPLCVIPFARSFVGQKEQ